MKSVPTIHIDISSRIPAYEQIAGEIRAILVTGCLKPGAPLPTVRQLAVDLNVHHNTVAHAYRILAREGWLHLRRRRGARVLPRSKAARSARNSENLFRVELRRFLAGALSEGISPAIVSRHLAIFARHVKRWPALQGGS